MKFLQSKYAWILAILLCGYGYILSCTHDDELIAGSGPNIERGNEKLGLSDSKVSHDKSHSNVGWETAYIGSTALLTGRFNSFGINAFEFDESNTAGISFEAWVWVNSVNTSEPGRDQGCLQGTFGTTTSMTTEAANVAVIKSKSVEFSKTDKGYIVKADLTFHGVTKEVTAKLNYVGKAPSGNGTIEVYGFNLQFNFLAKTDFQISSTNIGDNIDVYCNAIFRKTL